MRAIKIIALAAVLLVAFCIAPIETSEGSTVEKARVSGSTVYHFTGAATEDVTRLITDTEMYVYEQGQDDSMKAYLADHSKNPDPGVMSIVKGTTYEVYSIVQDAPSWLEAVIPQVVLESYGYALDVKEGDQWKLSIKDLKFSTGKDGMTVGLTDGNTTQLLLVGSVTTASNMGDAHYQFKFDKSIAKEDCFYLEITFEKEVRTLNGSPTVYVIASIVIILLVALLIAICGRRPKFD